MKNKQLGITISKETEQSLIYVCKLNGLSKSQAIALALNNYALSTGFSKQEKLKGKEKK